MLGDELTIDEYERLPDVLARNHELVDGELVDVSGDKPQHNELRDSLVELLRPFVRENQLGSVISEQEYDFDGNAHGPDVSFYNKSKRPLLNKSYEKRFSVRVVQGWGLTETSPVASLAFPPKNGPPEREIAYRSTAGRVIGGVEVRVADDSGAVLPRDGRSVGEIEVRGPWVTEGYYLDPAPAKFHDGWLRTGDVGCIDAAGYIAISDRAKDVVKSGGEWISSLDLEAALLSHPAVREAAVIAAPDERWGERPLACITRAPGSAVTPEDLRAYLADRVVRWWLPERWAFIDEVPRTSVGKCDKKLLRARNAEGGLNVVVSGTASRAAADGARQAADSPPAAE